MNLPPKWRAFSLLPLTYTPKTRGAKCSQCQRIRSNLDEFRSMQRCEVEIPNRQGLNAPTSTKLTQLAAKYQCDASLARSGRKVNAKSLVGVMMLAAAKGSCVVVETANKTARYLDAIPPGEILREKFMRPLGVSINTLGRDLDVPPNRISEIVNGKRAITSDTALRLGKYFGVSPEIWLDLQSDYEPRIARRDISGLLMSVSATAAPCDGFVDLAGRNENGAHHTSPRMLELVKWSSGALRSRPAILTTPMKS